MMKKSVAQSETMVVVDNEKAYENRQKYCVKCPFWPPPSLMPTLWNIGILLHKQATLGKYFGFECIYVFASSYETALQIWYHEFKVLKNVF